MKTSRLKVLHVANFPQQKAGAFYYSQDHKFSAGLMRNHCYVLNFSYREAARAASVLRSKNTGRRAMNRQLLQVASQFRPDLLLLGHCELVSPQTLAEMRSRLPQMRAAQWWVDSLEAETFPVVGRLLPHLDALFTTHGADFAAGSLRQAGQSLPPVIAFVPYACDMAVESGRAFASQNLRHDLFFAGRPKAARPRLHDQLRLLLADRSLGLYGEKGKTLFGAAYMDAIGHSRCGLNINVYSHADLYSSDRMIHLAANGTLLLSVGFAGMDTLFSDSESVAFGELAELPELLKHWLEKDRWRKVAAAGWQRAHSSYAGERVMRWLLDVALEQEPAGDCQWRKQIWRAD